MSQVYRFKDNDLILVVTDESFPENAEGVEVIESTECTHSSWNEYILFSSRDKIQSHLNLIRRAVIELNWVGKRGSEIANDWYFTFSDGTKIVFTWRGWAEMMTALVEKGEPYMEYYC